MMSWCGWWCCCDCSSKWMFFPLYSLALSSFSCWLLLCLIPASGLLAKPVFFSPHCLRSPSALLRLCFDSVSLLSLSSVLFSFLTVMKGWRRKTHSVLVLLEGKEGFCWFGYCGWDKVQLRLVLLLKLRKDMAAEEVKLGEWLAMVQHRWCC